MTGVYKKTAQEDLSDNVLTLAGAIGSVCNGSSRPVWAALQDHYGFRKVYLVVMCIQMVVSASIYYVKTDSVLYTLWVAVSFLCEGAHFSQFPAITSKIFGQQNGGEIFTIIFLVIPASSALSYLMNVFGKESIHPATIFWISSIFSLANIVLLYFLDERPIK